MGSNGEPRRLASHQLALAIGALLIALVAGLAVTSALVLRKSEIQVWEGQMRNASLLLAEHVNQTTASAFMALDLLAERVRASASRVSDEREYQRVVRARCRPPSRHDRGFARSTSRPSSPPTGRC
jgi:hypothetical protein